MNITPFSFSKFEKNPSVAIIGQHDCGKTTLCKKIIDYYSDIPSQIIMTQKNNIETDIKNILANQQKYFCAKTNSQLLLILDDCFNGKDKLFKTCYVKELFCHAKNYNITLISTFQCYENIPREIKASFDNLFLFYNDNSLTRNCFYCQFAEIFKSFNNFHEIFLKLKNTYNTLVLLQNYHGTDNIFSFSA